MAKTKVADLPKEEQEKLIAEMKEHKLGGVYMTYTVEAAKNAIKKKKAQVENPDGATPPDNNSQEASQGEQTIDGDKQSADGENNGENGDLNGGKNEQTEETEENPDKNGSDETPAEENLENAGKNNGNESNEQTEESVDSIPEDVSQETKDFLNGETHKPPSDAEVITEQESEELQKDKNGKSGGEKPEKPKKAAKNNEPILVCHICRSRVYSGVCSGCGYKI